MVYTHDQNKHFGIRSTIAIEALPSQSEILMALWNRDVLLMNVGFTAVHPNDQFEKSVGRTLAANRVAQTGFKVASIHTNNLNYEVILESVVKFNVRGKKTAIQLFGFLKQDNPKFFLEHGRLLHV